MAYPTFTKAAQEKNAENVVIIRDKALAAQYTQNWEAHRQRIASRMWAGECPGEGDREAIGHVPRSPDHDKYVSPGCS